MAKPFAVAICTDPFSAYTNGPREVAITKSRARRCVAGFYAPGWRPMAFTSVEAAKAKMERHPGFVRWA